jgi:hypothetical protein
MAEIWIDIFCPYCKPLGYPVSRHLMTIYCQGEMVVTPNQYIMSSCKRCHTKYKWTYGMKLPILVTLGHPHHSKYSKVIVPFE